MHFALMIAMLLTSSINSHQTQLEDHATSFRLLDAGEPQGIWRFDYFGEVSSNDEKARLDNYATQLQSQLNIMGYIIVYGRRNRPGEAKKRADRAKHYLWYNRQIDTKRVDSVDHCFAPKLRVELWVYPKGAKAPDPCPKPKRVIRK